MAKFLEVNFDSSLTDSIQRFSKAVQEEVALSGVAAMARVIYEEVKANTSGERMALGRPGLVTGNLNRSIYRAYSPERSKDGRQTYRISWNKKDGPHGYLVEYGHWRINVVAYEGGKWIFTKQRLETPVWTPAYPFLRPAFDRVNEAIRQGKERMSVRLKELTEIEVSA